LEGGVLSQPGVCVLDEKWREAWRLVWNLHGSIGGNCARIGLERLASIDRSRESNRSIADASVLETGSTEKPVLELQEME
jgi:hypothetical protein